MNVLLKILKWVLKKVVRKVLGIKENQKLIYVCSPLRGNPGDNMEENREKAIQYSKLVADANSKNGDSYIPITPHAYFTLFLDDTIPEHRNKGMSMANWLLLLCDELWVFGHTFSEGMRSEIMLAESLGLPVYYALVDIAKEEIFMLSKIEDDQKLAVNSKAA